ncbi:MAG: glutamine-hydrolyzing carbamoyl-phosphate synthase small subunit [SAR324 cluster bacterium]|jgi:carbamoyl-phosphate synthase small subunit|nr:glutamine-hydrolyzing carbamoyl-phosphate synthase small subunit [SAR324 cluster bacterium]MDP6248397.1 glutamine-hydrolyzing carbamoyl-phosphate synthase small subunit [SAR324 cluster bacterium]MDP6465286.1 glutamine-hydrolyzing carbamoyl-phosphate synthase small subunit [SAR324 cluster bacterium]MDP7137082.1 glutamine-hydrolyzing carbamoyl-phosphate synthase small subunit [SAR324 cluster bacterium]MDP7335752.1 glutamine-hydrolyzing carbamoyl-phosphate synthase small subunit [SAR324 cluster|tara:strand:- start:3472 stop:4635 length:1164 start_codon:yes stop_codon:yes gene_type:complete
MNPAFNLVPPTAETQSGLSERPLISNGLLVLSNGMFFRGKIHGPFQATGELIFNTSMSGYQEILSDPSYSGQIVTMTAPHIGNYGTNPEDMESSGIHASALVVTQLSRTPSNWRSKKSLPEFLMEHRVPVMEGVDTRALVRVLRSDGEVKGLMVPSDSLHTLDLLREEAMALPSMEGRNLAQQVSTQEPYFWPADTGPVPYRVVAYDFGIKRNILRLMAALGISITVVPWNTPAEVVKEMNPDGVFLSNGPGDPAAVETAIEEVRSLLGIFPIFGICLGHQILALALGCTTYKLKCGHHGGNHPVIDFQTDKIEITSHNHGFSVDEKSLPDHVRVTHRNLNDKTVEGLESLQFPAYSVQYHPEAAPGPRDARYLFQRFVEMMGISNK